MPNRNLTDEDLHGDVEELISILAQQADSRSTNLQVYIEELNQNLAAQEKKRWQWFYGVVTSVLLVLVIFGFEVWERQYDRVSVLCTQVTRIEERVEFIRSNSVGRVEFSEMRRRLDKELEKLSQEIESIIRKEGGKDLPRSNDGE